MLFFRSLIFNICFFGTTALFAIFGLPWMIASQNGALFILHSWGKTCLPMIKFVGNIDYEVRGAEHITSQPVIYACKHQSAWDIVIMAALLPRAAFVLKKELLLIPLMGWFFIPRQKMIVVDRKKGSAALKKMVADAKAAMHDRRCLLIYPEGTRTRPGAPPAYHPGIAALYAQLMVPVVPVALNSGVFWGRGSFFKYPGKIVVEFLPPILPGLPGRELMKEVQDRIETASNRLMAEAGFVNPTTIEGNENAPLRQKAG